MRCCWLDLEACVPFSKGFAYGPPKISLHGLQLFDVDHWENPDPEAYKRRDHEIASMQLPIVSDQASRVVRRIRGSQEGDQAPCNGDLTNNPSRLQSP